jgi:hypothetical protein
MDLAQIQIAVMKHAHDLYIRLLSMWLFLLSRGNLFLNQSSVLADYFKLICGTMNKRGGF